MKGNPWHVESIHAFYFLKCPECGFDTKEEKNFQTHAIQNHPMSSVLFGERVLAKKIVILEQKPDPDEYEKDWNNQEESLLPSNDQIITDESTSKIKEEMLEEINLDIPIKEEQDYYETNFSEENSPTEMTQDYFGYNDYSIVDPLSKEIPEEINLDIPIKEEQDYYETNFSEENSPTEMTQEYFEYNDYSIVDPLSKEIPQNEASTSIPLIHESRNKKVKRTTNAVKKKANDNSGVSSNTNESGKNKCDICNKTFSYSHALNRHVKTVHLQMRSWTCEFCEGKFKQRSDLNNHVLAKHHKVKPWSCHYCNSHFTQKSNLTKHIKSMHENQEKMDSLQSEIPSFK